MTDLTIIRPNPLIIRDVFNVLLKCSDETDFLSCSSTERLESGFSMDSFSKFLNSRADSDNDFFIALYNGKVIGMLGVHCESRSRFSHRASIGMNILKKFWGIGAGTLLLDTAIKYFYDTATLTKLELEVRSDNDRAISLYQRMGFVKEATIKKHFLIGTTYYSVDRMCIMK